MDVNFSRDLMQTWKLWRSNTESSQVNNIYQH